MALGAIIEEPQQKADGCVIWLHGLGADGYDFAGVVPSLHLASRHGIRFIFPHAPSRPITINGGYVMPAWYDVTAIDFNAVEDEVGIKQSERELRALIQQQISQGIPAARIIIMGFSQGGALALHTALRYEEPLAGVAVLSAYLPLHTLLAAEKHQQNIAISIFMAHGQADPVVPYQMGETSAQRLQEDGYSVQWHRYPIEHTVSMQELDDLGRWISERLSLRI
jgi:phospholipase/carboxylesterase